MEFVCKYDIWLIKSINWTSILNKIDTKHIGTNLLNTWRKRNTLHIILNLYFHIDNFCNIYPVSLAIGTGTVTATSPIIVRTVWVIAVWVWVEGKATDKPMPLLLHCRTALISPVHMYIIIVISWTVNENGINIYCEYDSIFKHGVKNLFFFIKIIIHILRNSALFCSKTKYTHHNIGTSIGLRHKYRYIIIYTYKYINIYFYQSISHIPLQSLVYSIVTARDLICRNFIK
jgi:hypothetical protein